jgi:hypothetical protein
MKKIEEEKLAEISGAGCYKHLRRMHRDVKKNRLVEANEHHIKYLNCMLN